MARRLILNALLPLIYLMETLISLPAWRSSQTPMLPYDIMMRRHILGSLWGAWWWENALIEAAPRRHTASSLHFAAKSRIGAAGWWEWHCRVKSRFSREISALWAKNRLLPHHRNSPLIIAVTCAQLMLITETFGYARKYIPLLS